MGARCARLGHRSDATAEDASPAAPAGLLAGLEADALRSFRSASVAVAATVRLSRHRKRLLQEEWLSEQLGGSLGQPHTQTSRSTSSSVASRRNSRLISERQRLQDAAFTLSASLVGGRQPPGHDAEPQEGETSQDPLAGAPRRGLVRRCLAAVRCWSAAPDAAPGPEAPSPGASGEPAETPSSLGGVRARTAPSALLRRSGIPCNGCGGEGRPPRGGGRQQRLIEMLYVVGHRARASEAGSSAGAGPRNAVEHEPCVLARLGQDGGAFGDASPVPLLDERIASFCLPSPDEGDPSMSGYPPNVPFVFTVLAAVLQEDGMETTAPDPTDVLYCIAVCFDDLLCITGDAPGTATGVGPYAYCVVSRHPFVEAFGSLLLRLHAGEALSLRPQPSSASLDLGIFGRSSSHMGSHQDSWPVMKRRLRLAAAHMHAARPLHDERGALRRGRSAPARALAADARHLNPSPSLLTSSGVGLSSWKSGEESSLSYLDMFVYGTAQSSSCPAWANVQARQRCDTLAAWAAPPLFEKLGVNSLLRVLTALLLEMRVLVVSRCVSEGSAMVFGLSSLLWPLSWQHLLLPIVPLALQDAIIDAPVPFLCALREVSPHLDDAPAAPATWSLRGSSGAPGSPTSRTTSTTALSEAARSHGVVICDVDRGTVKLPADFAGSPGGAGAVLPAELETRRAALEGLRAQLLRAPCEAEKRSAAASARGEILSGLTELAQRALDASKRAASRSAHGSGGWLSAVQDQLCWGSSGPAETDPPDGAFRREFVNTEACLMLLAAAAPAAPPHQGA